MDPGLEEIIAFGTSDQEVEVMIKLKDIDQYPDDIRIVSRFGDVATCRLKCGKIKEVWSDEQVVSLKAPRLLSIDLEPFEQESIDENESTPNSYQRRPDSMYTGKGVVVGIADWGIDFTHPNFLKGDGTTRFLSIWDQSAKFHNSAVKYGYGRIFSKEEINSALQSPAPFKTLGYHPAKGDPLGDGAHGTHVLDIAAGNGSVGQSGVAPEADLVAVHLTSGKTKGLASLGDSVKVMEAVDFVGTTAGNQALVMNMSVGQHGGNHQGKSLVEQAMDNFLKEKPGRSIVQSTGNYYTAKAHSSGRINQGKSKSMMWEVSDYDKTPNELEVWYSDEDTFEVALKSPENEVTIFAKLGEIVDVIIEEELVGRLYHREKEPNTGDNHIDVFLYNNAPTGSWELTLTGAEIQNGTYHSWIERDSSCRSCQSIFEDADVDPNYTTGTICNGYETIAVGAYNPHVSSFELAAFSSAGPTVDGRQKPNLVAPGWRIQAAKSASWKELKSKGELTIKSGTSMAAPHVAGTIALILSASEELIPITEIRERLLSSVIPVYNAKENRIGEGAWNIPTIESTLEAEENVKAEISLINQNLIEMDENNIDETAVEYKEHIIDDAPAGYLLDNWQEEVFDEESSDYKDEDFAKDSFVNLVEESLVEESMDSLNRPPVVEYPPLSISEIAPMFDFHRNKKSGIKSFSAPDISDRILYNSGEKLGDLQVGDIIINRGLGEGKLVFQHQIQEALPQERNDAELSNGQFVKIEKDKWLKVASSENKVEPNIMIVRGTSLRFENAEAQDWNMLKNLAVQTAIEEWAKWGSGKSKESDPKMRTHLKKYWAASTWVKTEKDINDYAQQSANNKTPWSAAFISYVFNTTGVGKKFKYSGRHWDYANAAKMNRINKDIKNPFWLYDLNEVKPEIGDMICAYRFGKINYDNIQSVGDKRMHCDIVVQVGAKKIWMIGGNVSNTVSRKTLDLNSEGFVKPQKQVFAIIKYRPYSTWRPNTNKASIKKMNSGSAANLKSNPHGIDIERAIRFNSIFSKKYGWGNKTGQILKFLKLGKTTRKVFVLAIASYQKKKNFPPHQVNGILDLKTWNLLRRELNASNNNPLGIDIEKAIRLNSIYAKRYGWEKDIPRIRAFLKLKKTTPRIFSLAIADYQKRKNFPPHQIIGVLGPVTLKQLKRDLNSGASNLVNPLNINLEKAVKKNESNAVSLGWSRHLDKILKLLNLNNTVKYNDEKFALAVASYQEKLGFSKGNVVGFIGPSTLDQIAQDLGLDQLIEGNEFVTAVAGALGKLNFAQKETIVEILKSFKEYGDEEIPKVAYILATAWHESRLKPVRECFADTDEEARACMKKNNRKYGVEINGHVYYGRGFVQLTWEDNYRRMGEFLSIDLLNNPDLALTPENASKIIVYGMINGEFTGKKLDDYIKREKVDFKNARRTVNGTDKSDLISGYATLILDQLNV